MKRLGLTLAALCLLVAAAAAWAARPSAETQAESEPLPPLPRPAADCDRRLQSESFLVADARGRCRRAAPDARRPVGSVGKLMTARLVLRAGALGERITVPPLRLRADEARSGLTPGTRLERRAVLRALLVPSGNDAAETLAATGALTRRRFVGAMNREAARLGLERTSYANPSGMPDPAQRSTARDSVELARLLMRDERFRRIVRLPTVSVGSADFPTRNTLLGRARGVDGVKTGTLNGNFSIVASATGRGGRVFAAALGAPSEAVRDRDAYCLLSVGRRILRGAEA